MGKAKIAFKSSKSGPQFIDPDKRWTVIRSSDKRRVYLESEAGISKEEAERLSGGLLPETEVVPASALDRFGKLDDSLLEEAIERAESDDEKG